MSPDAAQPGPSPPAGWRGTYGEFAFASLWLSVLSGIVLVLPYDVQDPYGSVATLILTNPGAAFFRNLHYWSAQAFFVLTGLHVWDHLRVGTERRVSGGVWLRLTLTLPVTAFLMISGFILKGDSEGRQALRILAAAAGQLPWLGSWIAASLFGIGERLQVVYVHHAATATIVACLFVIEHARAVWPRTAIVCATFAPLALAGLVLSPSLHDGLSAVIKGPWYFLGLQEALHWTPWPIVLVAVGVGLLALVLVLPRLPLQAARTTKMLLLATVVVYAGLCAIGFFFRGENWTWVVPWRGHSAGITAGWIVGRASMPDPDVPVPLPSVLGRPEGCLVCHRGVSGLGQAHRPDAVGCASCHGGNPFSLDKDAAHAGMILIPGNLAVAVQTCGRAACHPAIVGRVERSIMTTFSGVISVNRRVWGETASGIDIPHVKELGTTAADSHLRQLCASCHLGAVKSELGPIHEDSRGGGCSACHLTYSADALDALRRYETAKRAGHAETPTIHPALSLDIDNGHCFGCHSRSGRIATNYEGWHETELGAVPDQERPSRYRVLEDGRVFVRELPDIHQQKGLDCIDCHTAGEVMGDGTLHTRKSGQMKVACEDCHARRPAQTVGTARLDTESRRILALRERKPSGEVGFLVARAAGPLVNTVVDSAGHARMWRKRTGEMLDLRAPAAVCEEGAGHARLSCISCHEGWAPRCPACHTAFDPAKTGYDLLADRETRGAWVETQGRFEAEPPTLGIRTVSRDDGTQRDVVDTFIPGMVLTIDRNRTPGAPADPIFRRLYARSFSHTVVRRGRSCQSCHNDAIALGYGRGTLHYDVTPSGGRWRFIPAHPAVAPDGLPADAWMGFLQTRTGMVSTRDDVRPFDEEEQKRILRVGACLTCHADGAPVMRRSVRDFAATLARVSPRCLLPVW
jgi:hypothetical protein